MCFRILLLTVIVLVLVLALVIEKGRKSITSMSTSTITR
jgi:hypothetical protein